MEITSLQYSIDAAYKFYMHVRILLSRQNRVADPVYEGEAAGKDIIGGIQLGLLYSPCFW